MGRNIIAVAALFAVAVAFFGLTVLADGTRQRAQANAPRDSMDIKRIIRDARDLAIEQFDAI